jgi:uncharacterized damage-inducible protein DinB
VSGAAQSVSSRQPGVSFHELFAYTDWLAQRWFTYFEKHPAALDVEIGGRTGTMRELVLHICRAEDNLVRMLRNEPRDTERNVEGSAGALRAFHQENRGKVAEFMSQMTETTLNEQAEFYGGCKASKRKILTQIYLHCVHHWAQVAIEVRQAGFPTSTPQDIILTDVME